MEIIIDDNSKLCEIQEEFSMRFPYLKLEFFEFEPANKKFFLKENLITDKNKTIGQIRHVHLFGRVSINGHQKVSTLEKHFRENFGINIQVFRKSANTWLQTINTDSWTLTEQNRKGEEMDNSINEQVSPDFDEYHEQL